MLVHPVEGPVNLYHLERFASMKQRIITEALHSTCQRPGCNHAASRSAIHHVQAWSQGGQTNINNLVTLCDMHNSLNDDNPDAPRYGRMVVEGLDAYLQYPNGNKVRNTNRTMARRILDKN